MSLGKIRQVRFDESDNRLGTDVQTIEDPTQRSPGSLIVTFAAALDSSSFAGGVVVERHDGAHWLPLGPDQLLVGTEDALELKLLAPNGWVRGASYRVRLAGILDTQGRGLAQAQNFEWKIASVGTSSDFRKAYGVAYDSAKAAVGTVGGRFPGGQNNLFQGLWTDPMTGEGYARTRWYDSREMAWLSEDSLPDVDSSSYYSFVGLRPENSIDPMGLTARSDIARGRLFYTWNFGWIDTAHAENQRIGLREAWSVLKHASPGAEVEVELTMDQVSPEGESFKERLKKMLGHKRTTVRFGIAVASSTEERRAQLLYAFGFLSRKFEEYQGEELQGFQPLYDAVGFAQGDEKVASSYSTEDMFSNYLAFELALDGLDPRRYAIEVGKADEGVVEFSTLVWDYALPVVKNGSRGKGFAPTIMDPGSIIEARDRALQRLDMLGLVRIALLQELIRKYEGKWGVPRIPKCPREIQEGFRVIWAENNSPLDKLMFVINGTTLRRDQ